MSKWLNEYSIRYTFEHIMGETDVMTLDAIIGIIGKMPENLIRCKDCKYYTESKYFAPEKMCYRYKDNEGNKIGYIKSDNDFCSYGEREETE